MKTFIVSLEDHDDIISTRDKIAWGKAGRILLVWPRKGRVLERRIDLLLLQRHAHYLGAQLALVTQSGDVKDNARALGIPVFSRAEDAQKVSWRRPRTRRRLAFRPRRQMKEPLVVETLRQQRDAFSAPPPEPTAVRLTAFLAGILAFLALFLFFLPSAQVQLKPAQKPQELTISVWASPDVRTPNPAGEIPVQVSSVVVEGRDQLASTGRALIPDQTATGQVVLTNLTDQPVDVPAGTAVLAQTNPAVRFLTANPVSVPVGSVMRTVVDIRAELPGSAGNVSAGSIRAVEGPIGLRLSVENNQATTGGNDRSSPAPGFADYRQLREKLTASLEQMAKEEFQSQMKPDQQMLLGTLRLTKVIEETREPAEGQPADRLQLGLRAEYQVWMVSEADLDTVAHAALDANQEPGFQALPGSLRIQSTSQPVIESAAASSKGGARWQINARRTLEASWSKNQLTSALLGKSVRNARQILQSSLPLAEDPRIRIFPAWWMRMPFLPLRISVVQL